MAYTPRWLYQGQPGTTEAALTLRPFGASAIPANTKVIVKEIVLANVTASAATINISFVPSGGTAGNTNRVVPNVSVDANTVVAIGMNQVLESGDFISAVQGTASAITVTISGVVVT